MTMHLDRDDPHCAYCHLARAVNKDHVIPKSLAKKLRAQGVVLPPELCVTVPACFACNIRKGTRKLVPPSWESKIPALKEVIPGHWRVWNGDIRAPAYRDAHVWTSP